MVISHSTNSSAANSLSDKMQHDHLSTLLQILKVSGENTIELLACVDEFELRCDCLTKIHRCKQFGSAVVQHVDPVSGVKLLRNSQPHSGKNSSSKIKI